MKERRVALRQKVFFRRAAAWGAQRCPDWFVKSAPVVIGVVFSLIAWGVRRAVQKNLRTIRGRVGFAREQLEITQTFVEFARSLTAGLAPDRHLFAQRPVALTGEEHVRPLFESQQGMLLLTAHVGPWDACALRLRVMMDVPVMMLMSGEADPSAEEFHDAVRAASKVQVLRVGRTPLDALPLVEHLRGGGVVVAQLDRIPPGTKAVSGMLLGRPFSVPEGLFRLAATLKCPLIPVFARRLDAGSDEVVVHRPIWIKKRRDPREIAAAADQVLDCLGEHLKKCPTQWFHFTGT